jgi:NAD(P)H-dependent FMN reductase
MFAVIAGTNRPGSRTRQVAAIVRDLLIADGEDVQLLDLAELPPEIFEPESYDRKPDSFASYQESILTTRGLLTVVPEYNGSFPGVLKYFIDMLQFPDSLHEKPTAFVGISSGRWGAVRAVEQLEMIFQYRHAHLFGRRCFISGVGGVLNENGRLVDPDLEARLERTVRGFVEFANALA